MGDFTVTLNRKARFAYVCLRERYVRSLNEKSNRGGYAGFVIGRQVGRHAVEIPRRGVFRHHFGKWFALAQYGFPFSFGRYPTSVARFRAVARRSRFAGNDRRAASTEFVCVRSKAARQSSAAWEVRPALAWMDQKRLARDDDRGIRSATGRTGLRRSHHLIHPKHDGVLNPSHGHIAVTMLVRTGLGKKARCW